MKSHPILFSGEMVLQILRGEKTQTRRVLKRAYDKHGDTAWAVCPALLSGWIAWFGKAIRNDPKMTIEEFTKRQYNHGFTLPYGSSGDILWVRETWTQDGVDLEAAKELNRAPVHYRADGEAPEHLNVKWRPSIFMPRKYSRITLKILSTEVERLQDISESDALAEGVIPEYAMRAIDAGHAWTAIPLFKSLWDSLNAKRGYGWESNPWVTVIKFKECECAKGLWQ